VLGTDDADFAEFRAELEVWRGRRTPADAARELAAAVAELEDPALRNLAHRLVMAGPQALCDALALAGSHDRQVAMIGRLWRSPSTATDTVLGAIGELHPSKIVAKSARRARFQRRSLHGA